MTRITDTANATELTKPSVVGCVLVDLDFLSGHVRANDGFSECTFAGNVYSPLGQFGGIEVVEEGLDAVARPIKLSLSGVDSNLVGLAQNEVYQNRAATVYVGLLNPTTGLFVGTPEIAWEGRMDYMTISIDKGVGKIVLNCEHRLRREPRISRYTDVDQQMAYPGDTFFSFILSVTAFKSQWGNEKMAYGGPPRAPYKYPVQVSR